MGCQKHGCTELLCGCDISVLDKRTIHTTMEVTIGEYYENINKETFVVQGVGPKSIMLTNSETFDEILVGHNDFVLDYIRQE